MVDKVIRIFPLSQVVEKPIVVGTPSDDPDFTTAIQSTRDANRLFTSNDYFSAIPAYERAIRELNGYLEKNSTADPQSPKILAVKAAIKKNTVSLEKAKEGTEGTIKLSSGILLALVGAEGITDQESAEKRGKIFDKLNIPLGYRGRVIEQAQTLLASIQRITSPTETATDIDFTNLSESGLSCSDEGATLNGDVQLAGKSLTVWIEEIERSLAQSAEPLVPDAPEPLDSAVSPGTGGAEKKNELDRPLLRLTYRPDLSLLPEPPVLLGLLAGLEPIGKDELALAETNGLPTTAAGADKPLLLLTYSPAPPPVLQTVIQVPTVEVKLKDINLSNWNDLTGGLFSPGKELNLVRLYFKELEEGKLPTAKSLRKGLALKDENEIAPILEKVNKTLEESGIKPLKLFSSKGIGLLGSTYAAYRTLVGQEVSLEEVTLEKIAGAARQHGQQINVDSLADQLSKASNGNLEILCEVDSGFKAVCGKLGLAAMEQSFAATDLRDARKWVPEGGEVDLSVALLREYLSGIDDFSLISSSKTADSFLYEIQQNLLKIVEKENDTRPIKSIKEQTLFNKTLESIGLSADDLKVAWCAGRSKSGDSPYSARRLSETFYGEMGKRAPYGELKTSLEKLSQATDGVIGDKTCLDSAIEEKVKYKAKVAPQKFDDFVDFITKELQAEDYGDLQIISADVKASVEKNCVNEFDYNLYRAARSISFIKRIDNEDVRVVYLNDVQKEIAKRVEDTADEERVLNGLERIHQFFGERFYLIDPSKDEKIIVRAKDLDQRAKRLLGHEIHAKPVLAGT